MNRSLCRLLLFSAASLLLHSYAHAGVARYAVTRDVTPGNYQPIAGQVFPSWNVTFYGVGPDDGLSGETPIGFPFVYDGIPYTEFKATLNGCIILGPQGTHEIFSNILQSTDHKPLLAPFWDDLVVMSTDSIRYLLSGDVSAGTGVLTVQWSRARRTSDGLGESNLNFQLKLFQTLNKIEFIYGTMTFGTFTWTYSVGINDPIGGVGHFLSLLNANGTAFSSTVAINDHADPPTPHSRYTFLPPDPITASTISVPSPIYPTLKSAIDTLKNYGIANSLDIILGASTSETAQIDIDFIPGSLTHPVTVKLDATISAASITGSVAGPLIRMRGARNFTIDGAQNGMGSTRGLTIENTSTSGTSVIQLLEGAQHCVIKNTILKTNHPSGGATTSGVVWLSTANISTNAATRGVYGTTSYNLIENCEITAGASGRPTNGILIFGSTTPGLEDSANVVFNNVIRNFGGAATPASGIRVNAGAIGTIIRRNEFTHVTSATSAISISGIRIDGTTVGGTVVERNSIHRLSTSATTGILVIAGVTQTASTPAGNMLANNFINLAAGDFGGVNSELRGISHEGGTLRVYFNSVRIGGSNTLGRDLSSAFRRTTAAGITDIRNNIFYNARSAGSGARRHSGIVLNNTGNLIINHNDYFADGTNGSLGSIDGGTTQISTLAGWQTATQQDQQSISQSPNFIDSTDLHINPAIPTQLESGGMPITGITEDYDGDPRNPITPDIGADEGNFTPLDLVGPVITYQRLPHTSLEGARTLLATIVDPSNIDSSLSGAPRLWYRSGTTLPLSGPFVNTAGMRTTPGATTWQFTIPGHAGGTWVEYYVAAQDLAPSSNVSTSPFGTNLTSNPPNGTVASPHRYAVRTPLHFTVGAAGSDFNSITAALEALSNGIENPAEIRLNSNYSSAGEVFPIAITSLENPILRIEPLSGAQPHPATMMESERENLALSVERAFPIELSEEHFHYIPGLGVRERGGIANTLTIRPSVGAVPGPIIGIHPTAIVLFNGAAHVVLDSLEITNLGTGGTVVFANGARHNRVMNSRLRGDSTSTGIGVIWFATSAAGSSSGNSHNVIENCDIFDTGVKRPSNGIVSAGSPWPLHNIADTVRNCRIRNWGPASQGTGVFIAAHTDGFVLENNEIYHTVAAKGAATIGVAVGSTIGNVANTEVRYNLIRNLNTIATNPILTGILVGGTATANTLIHRNTLDSIGLETSASTIRGLTIGRSENGTFSANLIKNLGSAAAGSTIQGILHAGSIGVDHLTQRIFNNMIALGSDQPASWVIRGVDDVAFADDRAEYYFNSVLISGNATGGTTDGFIRRDINNVMLRNNIFMNSRSGGSGNHYAIRSLVTGGSWNSDYNNLYVDGQPGGVLGAWGGTNRTTLAAWQAATAGDGASISADPNFVSSTDLHIFTLMPSPVDSAGIPVSGITTDFDGNPRDPFTPDIGADEFSTTPVAPPVISNVLRSTRVPVSGDSVVVITTITDTVGIHETSLLITVDGITSDTIPMIRTTGTPQNGTYRGVIPGTLNTDGRRIEYRVRAGSLSGHLITTPIIPANSYFAGTSPLSLDGIRATQPDRQIRFGGYYARVTGAVNSPNFHTTALDYRFQDSVGGIALFKPGTTSPALHVGDSIVVIGRLGQDRGLTQIVPDDAAADISVVASGRAIPTIDLTVSEYRSNSEYYESRLIRLTHLYRRDAFPPWPSAGTSARIVMYQTQPTDTVIMRIESSTDIPGSPEPTYPIRITGIAGQFSSVPSTYDDGYEILPRYLSDIQSTLISLGVSFDSTNATVVLTWSTPPLDQLLRFNIYRAVGSDPFTVLDSVSAVVTSYTDTRVDARTYRYHLLALFENGLTVPSDTLLISVPFILQELEPNNSPATANFIGLGHAVNATLDPASDADWFAFTTAAGHIVIDGTDSLNERDVVLALFDSTGQTMLYRIDRNINDRLEFNLPYNGLYFVRMTLFGTATGTYSLYARVAPPTDPREPDDGPAFGFPMIATPVPIHSRDTMATIDPGVGLPGFDLDYRWYSGVPGERIIAVLRTRTTFPTSTMNGGYIGIGRRGEPATVVPELFLGSPLASAFDTTGADVVVAYDITVADTYYVFVSVHLQPPGFGFEQAGPGARYDISIDVVTALVEGNNIPTSFALEQNYPNPFNPETVIRYALPSASTVTLKVFNVLGQEITALLAAEQQAGYYSVTWNGKNHSGVTVGSGLYFYRLEATPVNGGNAYVQTKRMVLLR